MLDLLNLQVHAGEGHTGMPH